MATPNNESARHYLLDSGDTVRLRQRSCRLPLETNNVAWDSGLNDEGRPKTRRVNPQRLAIRLGPELVAEMEAYIVPGAKMPPFSIRKDFQERYSVDRRHIYDYFHSRGLRVAKEDKHTNLARGRAMKATALAQETPAKSSSNVMDRFVDKPPSLCKAKSINKATPLKKRITKVREKHSVMRRATTAMKKANNSRGSYMPNGDVFESYRELTLSGTDTDLDSTSTPPQVSMAYDSSDESVTASTTSDLLVPVNDFLPGCFGASDHMRPIFSETETLSTDEELLISNGQERLLSEGERIELYDLISGSISSSSSGTSQSPDICLPVSNVDQRGHLYKADPGKSQLVCNPRVAAPDSVHFDSDLLTRMSDDLDLFQSIMDPVFFSVSDGYTGFYDSVMSNDITGMIDDYPPAVLSPQNRLSSAKVSHSFSCAKQFADGGENVHPGTPSNSR